ncbi:hypothetical protein KIN20_027504 [Parelaphostrongylus tenuis]|uniref:Uncharacterized protein n=1 Tax=Parelaphostrongylus tenuis TaxID=148309 RepID=A0AAD5QZT4_PARTN|nr:hypothetical protein KIN20_027504 [Parelaphostrongylus tenuis]
MKRHKRQPNEMDYCKVMSQWDTCIDRAPHNAKSAHRISTKGVGPRYHVHRIAVILLHRIIISSDL